MSSNKPYIFDFWHNEKLPQFPIYIQLTTHVFVCKRPDGLMEVIVTIPGYEKDLRIDVLNAVSNKIVFDPKSENEMRLLENLFGMIVASFFSTIKPEDPQWAAYCRLTELFNYQDGRHNKGGSPGTDSSGVQPEEIPAG